MSEVRQWIRDGSLQLDSYCGLVFYTCPYCNVNTKENEPPYCPNCGSKVGDKFPKINIPDDRPIMPDYVKDSIKCFSKSSGIYYDPMRIYSVQRINNGILEVISGNLLYCDGKAYGIKSLEKDSYFTGDFYWKSLKLVSLAG